MLALLGRVMRGIWLWIVGSKDARTRLSMYGLGGVDGKNDVSSGIPHGVYS